MCQEEPLSASKCRADAELGQHNCPIKLLRLRKFSIDMELDSVGENSMPVSVLNTIATLATVILLSLIGTLTLRADQGVFDDRIVFGQSAALKGPAAALGLGMREGILAAFHEASRAIRKIPDSASRPSFF